MKEVVWIFGTSASGKETLINKLVNYKPAELIGRLVWKNKKIVACKESLDLIGGELDDLREQILEEVPKLLAKSDVVLIKWQYVDSLAKRLQRLKELLPETKHRIIELKVEVDELIKRLPNKKLWTNYGEEKALYDVELKVVPEELAKLSDQFEVVSLTP